MAVGTTQSSSQIGNLIGKAGKKKILILIKMHQWQRDQAILQKNQQELTDLQHSDLNQHEELNAELEEQLKGQ